VIWNTFWKEGKTIAWSPGIVAAPGGLWVRHWFPKISNIERGDWRAKREWITSRQSSCRWLRKRRSPP